MPKIIPRSAKDCIDFIEKHRNEIESGGYDVCIKPEWVKFFEISYIRFLLRFCPSSHDSLARSPFTPAEILEVLSKKDQAHLVAINPNTPINILKVLAKHKYYWVRNDVARNPNTPVDILEFLSKDESSDVRKAIAKNPKTPLNILDILSRDEYASVKAAVGENLDTPKTILKILSREGVETVKNNPNYRSLNCFVATVVYETPSAPEVVALRGFRDKKLTTNLIGRIFIECYYRHSPFLAKVIKNNAFLKHLLRIVLIAPLVKWIRIKGWDK